MTDEERDARRREMMEDATWRDEQRANNVKKYAEEDAAERERNERTKTKPSEFLKSVHPECISPYDGMIIYILNIICICYCNNFSIQYSCYMSAHATLLSDTIYM